MAESTEHLERELRSWQHVARKLWGTLLEEHQLRELQNSYWLTRVVLVRWLAFLYSVAFLIALQQNHGLLGQHGLLPYQLQVSSLRRQIDKEIWGSKEVTISQSIPHLLKLYAALFARAPTIFWIVEPSDGNLDRLAVTGLLLSVQSLVYGVMCWPIGALLWFLYLSLVQVGQLPYASEWESQLLEAGFLLTWISQPVGFSRFPASWPCPPVVLWACRWMLFRIAMGTGLSNLRGDQCWRDLTCMVWHYETQCAPGPLAWWLHHAPHWFHILETAVSHVVQLGFPVLLLVPGFRGVRLFACMAQTGFQFTRIVSGNSSFQTWLTLLPAIACLDDAVLLPLFPKGSHSRLMRHTSPNGLQDLVAAAIQEDSALANENVPDLMNSMPTWPRALGADFSLKRSMQHVSRNCSMTRAIWLLFQIALTFVVAMRSVPVIRHMFAPWFGSGQQASDDIFDKFRLVNAYGTVGNVTRERFEVVFQGARQKFPRGAQWKDYIFKCKPGSVEREPCMVSLYHYRLDWMMWSAAHGNYQSNPWLLHFAIKLLVGEPEVLELLEHGPFPVNQPPRIVRALHYRYRFSPVNESWRVLGFGIFGEKKEWWTRELIGEYMPPLNLEDPMIVRFVREFGWPDPVIRLRELHLNQTKPSPHRRRN